jgi:hypothetical protein
MNIDVHPHEFPLVAMVNSMWSQLFPTHRSISFFNSTKERLVKINFSKILESRQ